MSEMQLPSVRFTAAAVVLAVAALRVAALNLPRGVESMLCTNLLTTTRQDMFPKKLRWLVRGTPHQRFAKLI